MIYFGNDRNFKQLQTNLITKTSDMNCFSNIYQKILEKNNCRKDLNFFIFKVISSPRQSASLSLFKILISLLYIHFLKQLLFQIC